MDLRRAHSFSIHDRQSIYRNVLAFDVYAYLNWIWTFSDNKDTYRDFHPYEMRYVPKHERNSIIRHNFRSKTFVSKSIPTNRKKIEKDAMQTVNDSWRLNDFSHIVQLNEASPWTSRLWWFRAVRVGLVLWQISHTCGLSVWIFRCLFNVPRFLSQAPQNVHCTRGSSMPMCCVFICSWKPSLVLKTFAQTSQIRWSIRSCTFKICILSMWSDLKLQWNQHTEYKWFGYDLWRLKFKNLFMEFRS